MTRSLTRIVESRFVEADLVARAGDAKRVEAVDVPNAGPGMVPAAVLDMTTREYLCLKCAGPDDELGAVIDETYVCADCGEAITSGGAS
jgi:DNA-directed RNA polymerase subunit RPC12/RpoP